MPLRPVRRRRLSAVRAPPPPLLLALLAVILRPPSASGFAAPTEFRGPVSRRGARAPRPLWSSGGPNGEGDGDGPPLPSPGDFLADGLSGVAADVSSVSGVPMDPLAPPPIGDGDGGNDGDGKSFTRKQFDTFISLSLPYFRESERGRTLFGAMILLTFLNSGVSVAFSYVMRDFWSALSEKDPVQFQIMLTKFAGAIALAVPVSVLYRYQREVLSVEWREWMTSRALNLYYGGRAYYALERERGEDGSANVDNPDQRITEDVRTFTTFSLGLFITAVTSVIDLASFSAILYSIYPKLFFAIIIYAAAGSVGTVVIGKKLVGLNYEKLRREADFRYGLVRLRENAESIAFYGGEDLENEETSARLTGVIDNKKDLILTQRNLEFFTTAYQYLIQVLPVTVVSPLYFAGTIPLGVVSQSSGAFNHILNDLSVIINQFEGLSAFSAGIDRLGTFFEAVRDADAERGGFDADGKELGLLALPTNATSAPKSVPTTGTDGEMGPLLHHDGSPSKITLDLHSTPDPHVLRLRDLRLLTPDRSRTLIGDLRLDLPSGRHLLVVGNSGAGKSSLLRAVAGLWDDGDGTIERPDDDHVAFVPQRPYCTLGTLRDQLLYPSVSSDEGAGEDGVEAKATRQRRTRKEAPSDTELLEVLGRVDLTAVAERAGKGDAMRGLDARLDWSNTLSLGEQQRLAFGRLLVSRPRLAILDEATSALDMVTEARMYGLLKDLAAPSSGGGAGTTYVSVGHRPSLLRYHSLRLRLGGSGGEGSHELEDIDGAALKAEFGDGSFVQNL